MKTLQTRTLLGGLLGHLQAKSSREQRDLKQLQKRLSQSFLPDDPGEFKKSRYTFENADLFFPENISSDRLRSVIDLADRITSEDRTAEYRFFVREVPIRSEQVQTSVPRWAAGMAVDQSIGPFFNKDGRQFWFDFFKIEQLSALYLEGQARPALLFKAGQADFSRQSGFSLPLEPARTYALESGSIWINAALLSPAAPDDHYCGLTISGGRVSTGRITPVILNGQLTVPAGRTVTVELDLRQPEISRAGKKKSYGADAIVADISLPDRLEFQFSTQGSRLEAAAAGSWKVYGQKIRFAWNEGQVPAYDNQLGRVLIPYSPSEKSFRVKNCRSPFFRIGKKAPILESAWALPAATIDITAPSPAAGIGGMLLRCGEGLNGSWQGLKGGEMSFFQPVILSDPGQISVIDYATGNIAGVQSFDMWKDGQNPYGTSLELQFPSGAPFIYATSANGHEALLAVTNADVRIDRPVTVSGEAVPVRTRSSILFLSVSNALRLIFLLDDNILFDNTDVNRVPPDIPRPIALALHNALFKTTPVNGCLLFGTLSEELDKIETGFLFLTFGLMAYLPTLPDPYAANLGRLRFQFREGETARLSGAGLGNLNIWMWLVCQIRWQPGPEAGAVDDVGVSFHFASLQTPLQLLDQSDIQTDQPPPSTAPPRNICERLLLPYDGSGSPGHNDFGQPDPVVPGGSDAHSLRAGHQPDYQEEWDKATICLRQDYFALLDVSTNADLLGISFNVFGTDRLALVPTYRVTANTSGPSFPLQVEGMDVVSRANHSKIFTLPQISWEPVVNTAPKVLPGDPPGYNPAGAPGLVPNYYPDDGGPAHVFNNSVEFVPLAPIPLSDFIISNYATEAFNITSSLFTLPFGMRALAVLNKFVYPQQPPEIQFNRPGFEKELKGGRQLQLDAGLLPTDDYPMFNGGTMQINNVLDLFGNPSGAGTLGQSVGFIFNEEFKPKISPDILISRGVPLTRADLSGYGASIFSNWFNPLAQMAQTSQSKFDVWVGRAAHEVIQVRSIIYPWGIRVVRTIILFRAPTGYVYRVDTGWKAESDGKFDFSYYVKVGDELKARFADFEIHPGAIKGLFKVENIEEEDNQFPTKTFIKPGEYYLDDNNFVLQNNTGADIEKDALLQMVFFDADLEIENVVQGAVDGRVPSKKIMGFVQLAPRGIPLSSEALRALLSYQPDPVGGPLDCVIDIGKSGQQMRLDRFDVSNSFASNGADPVFAATARGNVILPKDGAWSMVRHQFNTGEVTPLPQQLSVPLIRIGSLGYDIVNIDAKRQKAVLKQNGNPADELLRIADPTELLRQPVAGTVNYGFLQSTDTQKALFLTPAFKQGVEKLLSRTPPLFVDAFRIVNSKAVFPNIGNAINDFGDAISLVKNGNEFVKTALNDAGSQVMEIMQIDKVVNGVKEKGFQLLKQVEEFDLPSTEWKLIDIGGAFKIYIEYKADKIKKADNSTKNALGSLNFDVNSFANDLADSWKSKMSNVALVVDLGPIKRLMTIKGNWNANKGAQASYGGSASDPDFPSPQIEFAPELEPVIQILQILQDLQGANYKDAFAKGLKLAMSNKAGSWEYKLEASKEIPVVRFPTPDFAYNDPNAPLKLEAGLRLGAYFNAALKVTTDANQLLPSAGGYLGFYGRLSVMCVSLSAATVYAVGQVNLDLAADTKKGPSLLMKFGIGAQLVVGLPVVGNVSVLYMVGVEIYLDASLVKVSAFLLFQGHAEILGGIVAVTITIEAKGTISRANDRTDLAAQVTFGLDISIFLVINISFSTSWQEQRQIA